MVSRSLPVNSKVCYHISTSDDARPDLWLAMAFLKNWRFDGVPSNPIASRFGHSEGPDAVDEFIKTDTVSTELDN